MSFDWELSEAQEAALGQQHQRPTDEVERYVLPEGLTDIDRTTRLLKHGDRVQKHAVLAELDDLLLNGDAAETLHSLLPLVQGVLLDNGAPSELHRAALRSLFHAILLSAAHAAAAAVTRGAGRDTPRVVSPVLGRSAAVGGGVSAGLRRRRRVPGQPARPRCTLSVSLMASTLVPTLLAVADATHSERVARDVVGCIEPLLLLLPPATVHGELLSFALDRADVSRPQVQRVASCLLLAGLARAAAVPPETLRADVVPTLLGQCQDTEVLVRRTAAEQLETIARAVDDATLAGAVLPELCALAGDEHPSVRQRALLSAASLLDALSPADAAPGAAAADVAAARDALLRACERALAGGGECMRWVRGFVLGPLLHAIADAGLGGTPAARPFLDAWAALAAAPEAEARRLCAAHLPAAARAATPAPPPPGTSTSTATGVGGGREAVPFSTTDAPSPGLAHVAPVLARLRRDVYPAVRATVAAGLPTLAALCGPSDTFAHLLPAAQEALTDSSAHVRAVAASRLFVLLPLCCAAPSADRPPSLADVAVAGGAASPTRGLPRTHHFGPGGGTPADDTAAASPTPSTASSKASSGRRGPPRPRISPVVSPKSRRAHRAAAATGTTTRAPSSAPTADPAAALAAPPAAPTAGSGSGSSARPVPRLRLRASSAASLPSATASPAGGGAGGTGHTPAFAHPAGPDTAARAFAARAPPLAFLLGVRPHLRGARGRGRLLVAPFGQQCAPWDMQPGVVRLRTRAVWAVDTGVARPSLAGPLPVAAALVAAAERGPGVLLALLAAVDAAGGVSGPDATTSSSSPHDPLPAAASPGAGTGRPRQPSTPARKVASPVARRAGPGSPAFGLFTGPASPRTGAATPFAAAAPGSPTPSGHAGARRSPDATAAVSTSPTGRPTLRSGASNAWEQPTGAEWRETTVWSAADGHLIVADGSAAEVAATALLAARAAGAVDSAVLRTAGGMRPVHAGVALPAAAARDGAVGGPSSVGVFVRSPLAHAGDSVGASARVGSGAPSRAVQGMLHRMGIASGGGGGGGGGAGSGSPGSKHQFLQRQQRQPPSSPATAALGGGPAVLASVAAADRFGEMAGTSRGPNGGAHEEAVALQRVENEASVAAATVLRTASHDVRALPDDTALAMATRGSFLAVCPAGDGWAPPLTVSALLTLRAGPGHAPRDSPTSGSVVARRAIGRVAGAGPLRASPLTRRLSRLDSADLHDSPRGILPHDGSEDPTPPPATTEPRDTGAEPRASPAAGTSFLGTTADTFSEGLPGQARPLGPAEAALPAALAAIAASRYAVGPLLDPSPPASSRRGTRPVAGRRSADTGSSLPDSAAACVGARSPADARRRQSAIADLAAAAAAAGTQAADWRTQLAIVDFFAQLPSRVPPDRMASVVVPALFGFISTGAEPVACAAVQALVAIARLSPSPSVRRDVLRRLHDATAGARNWRDRALGIHLLVAELDCASSAYVRQSILDKLLALLTDRVPDVRAAASALLPRVRHRLAFPGDADAIERLEKAASGLALADTPSVATPAAVALRHMRCTWSGAVFGGLSARQMEEDEPRRVEEERILADADYTLDADDGRWRTSDAFRRRKMDPASDGPPSSRQRPGATSEPLRGSAGPIPRPREHARAISRPGTNASGRHSPRPLPPSTYGTAGSWRRRPGSVSEASRAKMAGGGRRSHKAPSIAGAGSVIVSSSREKTSAGVGLHRLEASRRGSWKALEKAAASVSSAPAVPSSRTSRRRPAIGVPVVKPAASYARR